MLHKMLSCWSTFCFLYGSLACQFLVQIMSFDLPFSDFSFMTWVYGLPNSVLDSLRPIKFYDLLSFLLALEINKIKKSNIPLYIC